MSNYFNIDPWLRPGQLIQLVEDGKMVKPDEDFYMTSAFSNKALQFIKERPKENPFFLYLAYTAPHYPLHALPEDIALFEGKYLVGWDSIRSRRFNKMKDLGIIPNEYSIPPSYKHGNLTPVWDSLPQEEKIIFDKRMATHAAMIYRMDKGIGNIVDLLSEQGELDNTLIMFMSDNGATSAAFYLADFFIADNTGEIGSAKSFDSQGPSWANSSNTPLTLFKKYTAEGGINTSFIAHWPNKIEAGRWDDTPMHLIDIMPTMVEIPGGKYPLEMNKIKIKPMEGVSLVPVFSGKEIKEERYLYFEHIGNKAVRKGPWKLVNNKEKKVNPNETWKLFNIDNDPGEMFDLAEKYPEKVIDFINQYEKWAERVAVHEPYEELILAKPF